MGHRCRTERIIDMNNLILFVNSLLSYLLVFVVIVIVAGIAIFIGITMRKKKNAKMALEAEMTEETDAEEAVVAE